MIRINLLPVRAAKKQVLGKQQIFLFALVVVGTGILNFWWYSDRAGANDRLAAEVANLQRESAEIDRIIGEVKNIANERDKLKEKLKVLDTLKKGKTGPVKLLDAMSTAIPKNVWISSMAEAQGTMKLEGSAGSNDDLAEFMKGLANVVWTPEGMGRLVVNSKPGATSSQVELLPSGQIKDMPVDQVGNFFKNVVLKKANLRAAKGGDLKVVDFSLTMTANTAI